MEGECDNPDINTPHDEDANLAQANRLFETALMLLEQKRPIDKAIKCIQKAITLDDNNYRYWQLLGEAYFHRGSLNPSINCFIKSQHLALLEETEDDDELQAKEFACTHSKLRMSDIRLQAGHLDEASSGYNDIIATYPDHVDALIGLSKTCLCKSKQNFSQGLVKSGHSYCMQALSLVLRAIKNANQLSEAWQLASDCCLTQFSEGQRGDFETKLNEEFPGSDGSSIKINRRSCIELAQKFLCKALENAEPSKSYKLWHNIGNCLFFRALMTNNDQSAKKMLLIRAIKSYLKALDQDRNSSLIRNSIGIAAYHLRLYNTAQSFIIKSIHTDVNTSEIQFSNLGYIYLKEGELEKASAAFDRCQAEEPLYPRSWLGKAMVYEKLGVDNLSYLRHCHRLGNNYESQLKFASKVITLSKSTTNPRDLIDALDCMKKIVNYDDKSSLVWNTLGLVYERSGFYEESRHCFETAFSLEPNNHKIIINTIRQTINNECYVTNNEISSSRKIQCIKDSEKIADTNSDFMRNFIYYLFKNQDFQTVDTKVNQFMASQYQNDSITMASARMLLGLSSNKHIRNTDLFISNVSALGPSTSVECLINLTILMIITSKIGNNQYEKNITQELSKKIITYIASKSQQFDDLFYSKDGYWIKMALFSSIFCLRGKSLIKPILATFPGVAELWLFIGLEIMLSETKKQDTAISCIKKATLIGSTRPDLIFICDILLCILSVTKQKNPIPIESRSKYFSHAIFKYPDYGQLWNILVRVNDNNQNNLIKKGKLLDGINLDLFLVAMNHLTNKLIS